MRSESTFGPSTASSAGRTVSAASIATSTAAIPPNPIERRNTCGKNSSEPSAIATVSPENATVRPAVAIVVTSADSVSLPARTSSRNRRHDEQRVVDREAETQHGDDVDREDRHVGDQAEHPQHGEGTEDRQAADGERQAGRGQAAEDDDEQDEQDRHRQRLGAGDVLADLGGDVAGDRLVAAEPDVQPRRGLAQDRLELLVRRPSGRRRPRRRAAGRRTSTGRRRTRTAGRPARPSSTSSWTRPGRSAGRPGGPRRRPGRPGR